MDETADRTRPAQLPDDARPVAWQEVPDVDEHYGITATLLAAGVDPARIRLYRVADGGSHWVVGLDDGRTAVFTDDTEDHVGWLEGPWPFKALLIGPDGVRTEIDDSLQVIKDQVVRWHREAAARGGPGHEA